MRTYGELVDAIQDQLSRSDLTYKIPDWISMAEKALSRFIQLKDGELFTTGTLVPGQAWIDLPEGFKRAIHFEIQASTLVVLRVVNFAKRTDVLENTVDGVPQTVSYLGRRAYLAPAPAEANDYHLFYYGLPQPLSETNDTNDLLEMGPDVLMYEALIHSAPFIGDDERIVTWTALRNEGRETLKREYWDAQAGGGVLRIRPDFAPRDRFGV